MSTGPARANIGETAAVAAPAGNARVPAAGRFLGIDVGAETIKAVELTADAGGWRCTWRALAEHHGDLAEAIGTLLSPERYIALRGAAATGRLSRQLRLRQIPTKQAQMAGARQLLGAAPVTLASIGSHGFSILELRGSGREAFRENSRCSQGTGNFLRQLVSRFALSIEAADDVCVAVAKPAVLSGRCPVILKTDMTHLANKGEDRAAILAGLFDAVCDNVLGLIKPGQSPRRVVVLGGVAQSRRVRATLGAKLRASGMELADLPTDDGRYFEAVGAAVLAAADPLPPPAWAELVQPPVHAGWPTLPALRDSRHRVRRLTARPPAAGVPAAVVLGFDIGSTGAKLVALDTATGETAWESYRPTAGEPVNAAQALLRDFSRGSSAAAAVVACGVTGSGREIVGSLLTVCYGKDRVYILNEIAAHAEGAHHYDPRVDTIFEIGGQDAKYIRVADGRVIDCAMNEACSAGTGSFIEEQGRKFSGVKDVADLARCAMAADAGVSLGQHCSVFMAEVIDEAVAAGTPSSAIIAGLYDSIIQNYLNRVKGSRPVGRVIFCQGMPFAADALAAAVARQTGADVIVPPNPGTVGALGIALLARAELLPAGGGCASEERSGLPTPAAVSAIDPERFLSARIDAKDAFQCQATVGCGTGNLCRIERLHAVVGGVGQSFTWGGGCALYDKGTRKQKLPDRAPDPFREREDLVHELLRERLQRRGGARIALTEEFALKGLFPFFVTFLSELGFEVFAAPSGTRGDLRRGITGANVPFCAPMQMYHGITAAMAASGARYILLPAVQSLPRAARERHAVACPIVQASPDLLCSDLPMLKNVTVLSPVISIGEAGLDSPSLIDGCRELGRALGAGAMAWRAAHAAARAVQLEFDARALAIGARALAYCRGRDLVPVIVMGRPYTIYNPVLNSNVPAILREQGALGVPLDCYPVAAAVPTFAEMYWGYGQRILRAAHQVRRTPGEYSVYCSNYGCGPDSFNLHFFADIMAGKPFAIVETDGHSGDAGTKTRIEAFLHCVHQDRGGASLRRRVTDFSQLQVGTVRLRDMIARRERLLIPWMTDVSLAVAAALRGRGVPAESLPEPTGDALQLGRRHTSGKECLPIALTLGSLLQRLSRAGDDDAFVYLMASTYGPCRFGVYNLLAQIVLRQLGWAERLRIWSPRDTGYFDEFPPVFGMVTFAGLIAMDLLNELLTAVASEEAEVGAAAALYASSRAELLALIERRAAETLPLAAGLWEVASGEVFGFRRLLQRAARGFGAIRRRRPCPTVLLVGEIYVRSVPFANDFVADKLRQRGVSVRLAPMQEWLAYCDAMAARNGRRADWAAALSRSVQARVRRILTEAVDRRMRWPQRHETPEILTAARPYLRDHLEGEAVLTIGGPLCAWRARQIDGVLSAGPHECMPNKIAESQLWHIGEDEGLPSLTLPVNGDPVDPTALDNFAFEVHARWRKQTGGTTGEHRSTPMAPVTRPV